MVVHDLEVIWVMPREKDSQVPFLSRRMNGTVYTLEAVKTVFMDLFCTPKSSKGVNGHCGSTSRTFIVEDYSEDEYGQWAMDEVTGEQGYIDDERSCFWRWDDNEYTVAPIIISDLINYWPLCQNRKARKLSEFNYWRGCPGRKHWRWSSNGDKTDSDSTSMG